MGASERREARADLKLEQRSLDHVQIVNADDDFAVTVLRTNLLALGHHVGVVGQLLPAIGVNANV